MDSIPSKLNPVHVLQNVSLWYVLMLFSHLRIYLLMVFSRHVFKQNFNICLMCSPCLANLILFELVPLIEVFLKYTL
jgi:hypothetical protein